MNRPHDIKVYLALYFLVALLSVAYLFVTGASVFRLQYIHWNGALALCVKHVTPFWFQSSAAHFINGSYWIPYWCAVILLFAYKERVKFLFWIKRFCLYLIALYLTTIAVNALLSFFLPRLCGRSADLTHLVPHVACRFISPVGTAVTGATLLTIFALKRPHRIVKYFMVVSAVVISLSLLDQGLSFPFQMLCSLLFAAVSSVIAYIFLAFASIRPYNF